MVLEDLFTEQMMDKLPSLLIQLLKKNMKAVMNKGMCGIPNLVLFHQVMKSVELTLLDISFAQCLMFTPFLALVTKMLRLFCGLTVCLNSEKEFLG